MTRSAQEILQLTETVDHHEATHEWERSRILELESQVTELQLLTGWIVHDISAPLRAVSGFARILLEDHGGELSDDARDLVERQSSAGRNAIRLMEDVKRMIRSEAASLDLVPVDFSALASEVAHDIRDSYDGRPEIHVASDLRAIADPLHLRFLLQNLIDNAIKHCGVPAPVVTIGQSGSRPGLFFVKDNGVGFDVSEAERIFRPFERGRSEGNGDGTGLGLAIARRIVERHRGQLWAESSPGAGATFWFTLCSGGPTLS